MKKVYYFYIMNVCKIEIKIRESRTNYSLRYQSFKMSTNIHVFNFVTTS